MSDNALTDQQQFAKRLLAECGADVLGHRKWLAIMRFGMGTLKQSPAFLLCLIVERAYQCFAFQKEDPRRTLGEMAAKIAGELGLELADCVAAESDGAA